MKIKKYLTEFNNHYEFDDFINSDKHYYANVSYCDEQDEVHYEPIDRVSRIYLNKSSMTIIRGNTEQLSVSNVEPSYATYPYVIWKTSDPSIATVDQNGNVTALALSGSCTIYAVSIDGGNVSGGCEVNIDFHPVTGISISESTANIEVGGTYQLSATVLPSNASIKEVTWSSSDPSIVSVDSDGLLTANAVSGDVIITVTSVDNGYTDTCAVHIDFHQVTGFSLTTSAINIDAGDTYQLEPVFEPENASIKDIIWESSDPSVLSVDENGLITALNASGDVTVTATTVDGGYVGTCSVHINYTGVTGVTLDEDHLDFDENGFAILTASILPSDASNQNVTWKLSNKVPFTIQPDGLTCEISARNFSGDSVITVTTEDGRYTATCSLHINYTGVTSVTLDKNYLEFLPESPSAETLVATVLPADATDPDIVWTSSDHSIATVTQDGIVKVAGLETGEKDGQCVITATNVKDPTKKAECVVRVKPHYEKKYFTLKAVDGTATVRVKAYYPGYTSYTVYASTDGGNTWQSFNNATLTITTGGTMFKYTFKKQPPMSALGSIRFSGYTGDFVVQGNIMSLVYGDDFVGKTSLSGQSYAFEGMFRDECPRLVSAEDLIMPSTTLTNECYASMFRGCTGLKKAPKVLPATSVPQLAYAWMFSGCTSLETTPVISARTIGYEGCENMFANCASLTTPPEFRTGTSISIGESGCTGMFSGCTNMTVLPSIRPVPASSSATACCMSMFAGCTSITEIPSGFLPATITTQGCYANMFYGCTSLVTVPSDLLLPVPTTGLWPYCYSGMFQNCTSLVTAPDLLSATIPAMDTYFHMFDGCTSLQYIRCLATTIKKEVGFYPTQYWVRGVPAGGTFVKAAGMTAWRSGDDGIPNGWTVLEE